MTLADVDAEIERHGGAVAQLARAADALRGRPLNLHALAQRRAPSREWLIDQWLPRSAPVLLAGPGGCGKSLLMQQTATAQALNRDFIGVMALEPRVMVWGCEDDEAELWRRQEAISEHFDVDLDAPAERLVLISRVGCENTLMAPLQRTGTLTRTNVFERLQEQVNDEAIDSLWLDNVAHIYAGNPDDRNQVTTFINALMGMVTSRPLAVVLVTHTARAAGSEFAGSAAWENACRARWYFGAQLPDQKIGDEEETDPSVRYLARRKSNYSAHDHLRMTLRGGVLVPDMAPDRIGGLAAVLDDSRAEEIVLTGFRALQGMGIAPTDARNAQDFLPKQLVAKGLGSGYSVVDLGRAMNRLMSRGALARGVVGKYSNRSDKLGLVVVAAGIA